VGLSSVQLVLHVLQRRENAQLAQRRNHVLHTGTNSHNSATTPLKDVKWREPTFFSAPLLALSAVSARKASYRPCRALIVI
jgi:hypothetical protein